jgi:prepilin-type N-terminal cleavage/methylation domain-containing protein
MPALWRHNPRRGFTLVELLVVIAITATLLALLSTAEAVFARDRPHEGA